MRTTPYFNNKYVADQVHSETIYSAAIALRSAYASLNGEPLSEFMNRVNHRDPDRKAAPKKQLIALLGRAAIGSTLLLLPCDGNNGTFTKIGVNRWIGEDL